MQKKLSYFIDLLKNKPNSSLIKDLKLIQNLNEYEEILISDNFFYDINKTILEYDSKSFPSVACGIITFNEEHCIKRCLSSIYNEFDEIIVLDSISTDNTLNIIHSNFPQVKTLSQPWKNDFSHHRNIVINNASSDWIFFIDADNVYLDKNKGKAKRIAKLIDFLEIECVLSPMICEHNNIVANDNRRFFSLKNNILFFGKVHEEPLYSNKKLPLCIDVDILILHDGYNPQIIDQIEKNKRNIALTKEMIDIEPLNPKWLYFYARELYSLNEKDNNYIYSILKKCLALYENSNYYRYYKETISLFCKVLFDLNKLNELSKYLCSLEKLNPNCLDSAYYRGYLMHLDIQNRTKNLLDYLKNYYNSNSYFSLIDSSNDHLKLLIIQLLFISQDFDMLPLILKDVQSKEMKESILNLINMINDNIHEINRK